MSQRESSISLILLSLQLMSHAVNWTAVGVKNVEKGRVLRSQGKAPDSSTTRRLQLQALRPVLGCGMPIRPQGAEAHRSAITTKSYCPEVEAVLVFSSAGLVHWPQFQLVSEYCFCRSRLIMVSARLEVPFTFTFRHNL